MTTYTIIGHVSNGETVMTKDVIPDHLYISMTLLATEAWGLYELPVTWFEVRPTHWQAFEDRLAR